MLRGTSFVYEGVSIGGTPSADSKTQEDWARERAADRVVGCAAAMKRAGLAEGDYDVAKGHGFPGPISRTATTIGAKNDGVPCWSARKIDRWREEFKTFAKKVK